MSVGIAMLRVLWDALELHLPVSRLSDGRRLFDGKVLAGSTRSDILRAITRTFVEAHYLPIEKNARHDPVELIASALDVAIVQWSVAFQCTDESSLDRVCEDLALRVAAFETLFGVPPPNGGPWPRALDALASYFGAASTRCRRTFLFARDGAARWLASSPHDDRDAILATVVVCGIEARMVRPAGSSIAIQTIDVNTVAMTYAKGLLLLEQGQVEHALEMFRNMLVRAPGSVLALEQAARCFDALDDRAHAMIYRRRAGRNRVSTKRGMGSEMLRNAALRPRER